MCAASCVGLRTERVSVCGRDVCARAQGTHGHHKTDRMLEVCEKQQLPIVWFCEGGGGRPGDTESFQKGLSLPTFATWGRLSGLVPLVGLTSGYCFAGNAVMLSVCDVIIATEGSNIGVGGLWMRLSMRRRARVGSGQWHWWQWW